MTPTVGEDLLLLLCRPAPVLPAAGEHLLFPALAGAVLAELGLGGHVRTVPGRGGSTRVEAIAGCPPADDVLRSAWDQLTGRPREAQAVLAVLGPSLRVLLLDRLVRRGDLHRPARGTLGSVGLHELAARDSGHRERVLSAVRETLVGKAGAPDRIVAVAALLSACGLLRSFDPRIPWTPAVAARAEQLERDHWAALVVAEAVGRSVAVALAANLFVAAAVLR
ncbi:GOLPH3/VPS74 family protein [Paractinoplanes lichenicola]|uniref:GPP34 family phosphoprotein n=1 Tax=Paractinoplanes lichenicola TaxID=2802976 RepID=A0ABS1W030_9ACTN|nr:GPP34 family phosphoprotein [Actinoplanes lichenicola]MBL7260096.1 GPP34 family phosphoprotein [Actinoplanes lichenicola]